MTSRPPSGPGWWSTKYSRPRPARPPRRGSVDRVVGGHEAYLGRVAAAGEQHGVRTAAGGLDLQLEPPVLLLPDLRVVVLRRAEDVAPHRVRPVGLVQGRVEQSGAVGRPGQAVVRPGQDVGQVGAGAEVAHPQLVDLVAVVVDGVGQQPAVRARFPDAELEEVVPGREHVLVQDHLVGRRGRCPGRRRTCTGYCAPAGRRTRYSQPLRVRGADTSSSGSAAASSASTAVRRAARCAVCASHQAFSAAR